MDISFSCESAHVQMASNNGLTLSLDLTLKPDSSEFQLRSGLRMSEIQYALTVYPLSQSPYAAGHEENGRVGEFGPVMSSPSKEHCLYSLWVHVPDDQFNALLFACMRGNFPTDISFWVDDGSDEGAVGGLEDGVYNDVYPTLRADGGRLALQSFLFTVQMKPSHAVIGR